MRSLKILNVFNFVILLLVIPESTTRHSRDKECVCKELRILCKFGGEYCKEYRELCKCTKTSTSTPIITTTPMISTTVTPITTIPTPNYPDHDCSWCKQNCGDTYSYHQNLGGCTWCSTINDECYQDCQGCVCSKVPECNWCLSHYWDLSEIHCPYPTDPTTTPEPTTTTQSVITPPTTTTPTPDYPDPDCSWCRQNCVDEYSYQNLGGCTWCSTIHEVCFPGEPWPPISTVETTTVATPELTTTA